MVSAWLVATPLLLTLTQDLFQTVSEDTPRCGSHSSLEHRGPSLILSVPGAVIRGLRTGSARLFSSEGFELI